MALTVALKQYRKRMWLADRAVARAHAQAQQEAQAFLRSQARELRASLASLVAARDAVMVPPEDRLLQ